ncbi:WxL protein peptidoglycan domain-containing protein [Lentzea sp. NPDC058436]|uniref:WxL protein peptidoglycan domain-containing protein n=1 Tax=Lentzea sp. NPDC058436 TaxID=3346499 RepID=UPI00364DAEB4
MHETASPSGGRDFGRGHRPRRALAVLLAALWLFSAAPAIAQPAQVTWSVTPSKEDGSTDGRVSFRYDLAGGRSVDDHVTVTNLGAAPASFRLYSSDGVTTDEGVFDLLTGDRAPVDSGAWIKLGVSELTLAAGEKRTVPFTLTVPADAKPGDHPAGIVAALAASGDQVGIERRIGARVHLRVDGEVTARLEVAELDADYAGGWEPGATGPLTVRFDVVNTGNVRLGGRASVRVAGPFGTSERVVQVGDLPEILPGFRYRAITRLENVPALFALSTSASVEPVVLGADELPARPEGVGADLRTWAMPWLWTVIGLGAVAVATAIALNAGRHRRRLAAAVAEARAEGVKEGAGRA